MTSEDVFINEVLSALPPGARRAQIELDMRAHLAERVEHGYFVVAEYYTGQTVGKRAARIRTVTETGACISIGQALLRQLPMVAGIFILDIIFALFTEHNQRAFELISKTRVVQVDDATM